MAQVDIGFDVQLGGKGLTDLEKLQKTLEEIEKKSKIKLPTNSDSGGLETSKEKNKLETIAIQNLQLKQKLIEAENKGYAETQNKLQKLMEINQGLNGQAEVITQKQWEELKLIEKKESSIRKQKEEEIRLTQEVNKALLENKKVSDSVLKEKTQQQLSDQYGGFSKSKELEDMKKFYEEQDKENKKAQDLEIQLFNQNLKLKQEALKKQQEEQYKSIQQIKEEEKKKDKELMDRLQQVYDIKQKIQSYSISSSDKEKLGLDAVSMEKDIEKGIVDENFKYKLNKLKEYLSVSVKENISVEKLIEEEKAKISKNKVLENAINNSKIEKDKKVELLNEIQKLNKNIFDADYKTQYSNIQKLYQEEKKKSEDIAKIQKQAQEEVTKAKTQQFISDQYGGFSKSKELEAMKKFYEQQDKENKKAQELELQRFNQNLKAKQEALRQKQKEEYDAIKRQQSLKDRLFSIETDMIRNNLSRERYLKEGEVQKSFQDKLKELQNNKNLREQDLKEFEKYMKRASAINQVNRSNFTSDISQLMVVRQMKANFERTVLTMEKFEDAVYQAGIIGGKTGVEIRQLRNEMTQLGMEIPRVTQEIVEQIGSVARTGRTFEEAVKIVTNASNLAIVSGESLADSVNVLNKVMIAFDINIENTAKTMDILHSATLTTPLDLRAIADGMKNSASAMRNFIENTNRSGEELEDYKVTLLELNTALIGNQMTMGRTASSAGLSIRTNTIVLYHSDMIA